MLKLAPDGLKVGLLLFLVFGEGLGLGLELCHLTLVLVFLGG